MTMLYFFSKNKKNKGFTLVELLVVLAIVGILASIVLVSLNIARSKARDAKRIQDINRLIAAVEMYYVDNGVFPTCEGGKNDCSSTGDSTMGDLSSLQVVPEYMSSTPVDPINIARQYEYYYVRTIKPTSATTWQGGVGNDHYIVATRLENSSIAGFGGGYFYNGNLNLLKGQ